MKYTIPNQLTIIRIVLTPVFVFLILQPEPHYRLWATVVYVVASLTDWYDGYFARRFNWVTRWGQFMDPLADKLLVSSALIVFAYLDYLYWWMVWTIVIRDFVVTGLRIFALYIGKSIITSIIAKYKTFLQMAFTFALLLYMNIPGLPDVRLSAVQRPYLQWTTLTLGLVVLLTLISGIQYLIVNRSHVAELFRRLWRIILKIFQKES